MDWRKFKETKLAVKCTSGKDKFFSDCAEHGIYNFMGERAILRDYFVCRLCYKGQFSDGRYELMSCDERQIKENGLFGKYGLEVCDMSSKDLFSIMLDMFEGKSSAEETAMKMYEEYYGKEAPIDTCNCGCNEAEVRVSETRIGFLVTIQCKNCGFVAIGYDKEENKAKLLAKQKWNDYLKTKDYAVWKRGKNLNNE